MSKNFKQNPYSPGDKHIIPSSKSVCPSLDINNKCTPGHPSTYPSNGSHQKCSSPKDDDSVSCTSSQSKHKSTCQLVQEFCEQTTAHGWGKIGELQ